MFKRLDDLSRYDAQFRTAFSIGLLALPLLLLIANGLAPRTFARTGFPVHYATTFERAIVLLGGTCLVTGAFCLILFGFMICHKKEDT